MGFCQSYVLGVAEATPPDALRVRALNSGPLGVLGGEPGALLPLPCSLHGFVEDLRPDRELAQRIFSLSARRTDRTGATGRGTETDAPDGGLRGHPDPGST
jgi:hypothetical protein